MSTDENHHLRPTPATHRRSVRLPSCSSIDEARAPSGGVMVSRALLTENVSTERVPTPGHSPNAYAARGAKIKTTSRVFP